MNEGITKREDDFLSRTTIREANNHLQMLHKRNQELEQLVNKQKDELQQINFDNKNLFQANQLLEKHCQQLKILLDDRTQRLYIYERKQALFRETLELKPAIESLLDVLNTFEKEDASLSNKSLQFLQTSNKTKDIEVTHKIDTV